MEKYGETEKKIQRGIGWGIAIFFILLTLLLSFYTIPAGYRGVVLTFGKPSEAVAGEGLHLKIPYAQSVKKMEVRTQKLEVEADSSSKDLQDVTTIVALNYHIRAYDTNKLYQEIGREYRERVIHPTIQEAVKSIQAKFTAEELITKRPEVREGIKEFIREKLEKYYVDVDDFNIVDFAFSDEFDEAIEQKVTAEQLKLKADMDLKRIEVEAEQKIASATGEAEALRLQKQEITPDLIKLREVEVKSKALDVQREAVAKWNGVLPQVTSGIPFIDINQLQPMSTPITPQEE